MVTPTVSCYVNVAAALTTLLSGNLVKIKSRTMVWLIIPQLARLEQQYKRRACVCGQILIKGLGVFPSD